jgi:hypothetical protein
MDFQSFQKIPRLTRDVVITEKIDGTNAQIYIGEIQEGNLGYILHTYDTEGETGKKLVLLAGSRNRWIKPGEDNAGFAAWAVDNATELLKLGEGRHFGEWWGKGIQRNYGLSEKRFSLFNTGVWNSEWNSTLKGGTTCVEVPVCNVVPVLGRGEFDTSFISSVVDNLQDSGSYASPGFMKPEGVVIFHIASGHLFKKTIEKDESPKGVV